MSGYFKRMAQLARASSTPPNHSRLAAKPTGNKMISSSPAQLSKDVKTSNIATSSPTQSTSTPNNKEVSVPSLQGDIAEKNHQSLSNDIPAPPTNRVRESVTEPIKPLSGDALSRRTIHVDGTERTESLQSPTTPSAQAVDAQSQREPSVNPLPPERVTNPAQQRHRETHLSEQSSQRVASPVNLTPDQRRTTASHNSPSMPLSPSISADQNSDSEGFHTVSLQESPSTDKVAAAARHPQDVKPERTTAAPSAYRVAPHHTPALTPPPAPPQQASAVEVNIGAISLSLDPEPMAQQATAAPQVQSAPVSSAHGIWSSRRTLARSYVRRV